MSLVRTVAYILTHPLSKQCPIASLAAYAKWQIGSRLVPGPVVYDWVSRSKILVHRGETGVTGNVYVGLHEFEDMAFLLHVLRAHDLFIDVGANVGAYSVLASVAVGAKSVAFEPVPTTYARLLDNVRLNRADERIRCVNAAVGDAPGTIAFSSAADTTNHALAVAEHCDQAIDVAVTTLDLALGECTPALLKIDVEGFETLVIRGGPMTLGAPSLLAVIMELNGNGKRYGFDDGKLIETMTALGFTPSTYEPFSRRLTTATAAYRNSGNLIFVRDEEAVRRRLQTADPVTIRGVTF
jgi:FkbM family methyltransferase